MKMARVQVQSSQANPEQFLELLSISKARSTHIRIFLNPQRFLSGFKHFPVHTWRIQIKFAFPHASDGTRSDSKIFVAGLFFSLWSGKRIKKFRILCRIRRMCEDRSSRPGLNKHKLPLWGLNRWVFSVEMKFSNSFQVWGINFLNFFLKGFTALAVTRSVRVFTNNTGISKKKDWGKIAAALTATLSTTSQRDGFFYYAHAREFLRLGNLFFC